MKYIKKFNEELKSSTYRSAASSLDYYNKSSKASKLYDFADEKDYGFYNMTWGNVNNAIIAHNLSFTQPHLKGIYYGKGDDIIPENNSLAYGKNPEMMAEELVENWKNGQDGLTITFEFSFKATRQTLNELKKAGSVSNFTHQNSQAPWPQVPFFLELTLSEWYAGLAEWDEEDRHYAEENGEEYKSSTIAYFYETTKQEYLHLKQPGGKFGVFSDKKSALKFKKWLLSELDDKIKDSIINVLRIVSGTATDIERVIEEFSKMKIQGLYDDEMTQSPRGENLRRRWFNKQL